MGFTVFITEDDWIVVCSFDNVRRSRIGRRRSRVWWIVLRRDSRWFQREATHCKDTCGISRRYKLSSADATPTIVVISISDSCCKCERSRVLTLPPLTKCTAASIRCSAGSPTNKLRSTAVSPEKASSTHFTVADNDGSRSSSARDKSLVLNLGMKSERY